MKTGIGFSAAVLLAVSSALPAIAGDLLQIDSYTMTHYRAAATPQQGVQPRFEQRGVGIDGNLRAAPSFAWSIPGNPFAEEWNAKRYFAGVDLATGCLRIEDTDISLPTVGPRWVIGRTYNARQAETDGTARDSHGPQGENWFQSSMPELVFLDFDGHSWTDGADDVVYLVYGADRFLEFKRYDNGSNTFEGVNGTAGVIVRTPSSGDPEPDTFTYYDPNGDSTVFFGFDSNSSAASGQIWKISDAAGNTAYVGNATTGSTAISSGYISGRILTAYDASGHRFTYTYSTLDSVSRLTRVLAETQSGGSWHGAGGDVFVASVDYSYYSGGESDSDPNGGNGNLKLVTTTQVTSDSSHNSVHEKYYRYWTGSFSSENPGQANLIKLVLGDEGARKFDWAHATETHKTFGQRYTSATTDDLKAYSDAYLEYDSDRHVVSAFFNGQCGCTGGGNGTHTFRYEQAGSYASLIGNYVYNNVWATRTSVSKPGSSSTWITQYFDEAAQPLSFVESQLDPATTGGTQLYWPICIERSDVNTSGDTGHKGRRIGCIARVGFADLTIYVHSGGSVSIPADTDGTVRTYDRIDDSSALSGLLVSTRFAHNSSDDPSFERQWAYSSASKTVGDTTLYRPYVSAESVLKNEVIGSLPTSTDVDTTSYDIAFYSSSLAIKQIAQSLPTISSTQHGSGSAAIKTLYFRPDGTLAFTKAEDDIVRFTRYANGSLVEDVQDAKSKTYASEDAPSNWSLTLPASGLDVGETMSYDPIGRLLTSTRSGDGRVARWFYTVLDDRREVEVEIPKEVSGSPTTYYGPAELTILNHSDNVEAAGTIAMSGGVSTTTALTSWIQHGVGTSPTIDDPKGALNTSVGAYGTLQTRLYSESGSRVIEDRVYTGTSLPSEFPGAENTDYDATKVTYDDAGRVSTTTNPAGTIEERVYTHRGQMKQRLLGTSSSNMKPVYKAEFDGDDSTESITAHGCRGGALVKSSSASQVGSTESEDPGFTPTQYDRDTRGFLRGVQAPTAPHKLIKRDFKGRPIAIGYYKEYSFDIMADPVTTDHDRVGLVEISWDDRDRVYQYIRHFVTPDAELTSGQYIVMGYWYDPVGRMIKSTGPILEKYRYDRLGRRTNRYVLGSCDDAETSYSAAQSLSGDVVLEEHQSVYDNTTGQELLRVLLQRQHNSTFVGALDANDDNDLLTLTASDLHGRAQISAMWYDALDRLTTTADYGTNSSSADVATFARGGLSEPTSTIAGERLVSKIEYDSTGRVKFVTNPKGIKSFTGYDLASRVITSIKNYVDGTPGSGDDEDVTTQYQYLHPTSGPGLIRKVIAVMPSSGDNQETTYTYGVASTDSPASELASGDLLRQVEYPPDDSEVDNIVQYAYARGGMVQTVKDQTGNVIDVTFDPVRRETKRAVTTFGSTDYSNYVKSISRAYDDLGRLKDVYQVAADGSTVRDALQIQYNGWGAVDLLRQDPDSAVDADAGRNPIDIHFGYELSTGSRSTYRRTSMTMPSGQVVHYVYNSSGSIDNDVSRVSAIKLDSAEFPSASYRYLGLGRLVGTSYDLIDADYNQFDPSSGAYTRMDRFNRVKTSVWKRTIPNISMYQADLTFDSNGNPASSDDSVTNYNGDGWDVKYTNDAIDRLTRAQEGTLASGSISSASRDEQWQYSHAGNQKRHKLDLNGNGTFNDSGTDEIDDTSTFSKANELQTRDTDSNSSANYTLHHDAVGNLINDGKSLKLKYDPFGRLVEVRNQSDDLLAEYRYNGLGYLIAKHEDQHPDDLNDIVDSSDPWIFTVYDDRWRPVASFRDGVNDDEPKVETIYHNAGEDGLGGSSYVDDVLLRHRDAIHGTDTYKAATWLRESDGVLDETVYYCQNWHHDVVLTLDDSGVPIDRTVYSAYGTPYLIPLGDLDGDGQVDLTDYFLFFGYWDATDSRVDFNFDGSVDLTDFFIFFNSFDDLPSGGRGVLSRASIGSENGYAGYRFDAYTALYQVRNRWYSPELGRWISRDPLGYIDGTSLYGYAGGDPVAGFDPFGLHQDWTDWVIRNVGDASAGISDGLTFGLTHYARTGLGINDQVNENGAVFVVGNVVGGLAQGAVTGGIATEIRGARAGAQAAKAAAGVTGRAVVQQGEKQLGKAVVNGAVEEGADLAAGASNVAKSGAAEVGEGSCKAGASAVEEAGSSEQITKEITVDGKKYPESARHLEESGATDRPLQVNRKDSNLRRREATSSEPRRPGYDRDEAPPAVLRGNGDSVSVRHINPADNRGAGASIGNQLRGVPDGAHVIIRVTR